MGPGVRFGEVARNGGSQNAFPNGVWERGRTEFGNEVMEALNRAHTGREQAICGFKGVGDFEEFHLLDLTYLLNRFQLMYKQSRCGAQMLLTTMTAKRGRKVLENTENGPKAVNLRVKSACSEWFFASKGPLLRSEARLRRACVIHT